MRRTIEIPGLVRRGAVLMAAAVIAGGLAATQRQVALVRQDASDCSGSDVPNVVRRRSAAASP